MDLADPVRLLMYLFGSGPAPEACGVCWPCGPKPLPATGQTTCWGPSGEQVPCDDPQWFGEDAYYQIGCPPEGRFVDNGDGTVSDNCTGLMWQQETGVPRWDPEYGPAVNWGEALQYCDALVLGGSDDWRVPNQFELHSVLLLANEASFIGNAFPPVFPPPPEERWICHTDVYAGSTSLGLYASGHTGAPGPSCPPAPVGPLWLVRCVRGGLGPCGSRIPETGRRHCVDAEAREIRCDDPAYPGQDGFYRAGCPLEGRYADNGDGTITDRCTGLMWQKETAWPGAGYSPTDYGEVTFLQALRYSRDLGLGGHRDWRMPNIRELFYIGTWERTALDRPEIYPFEFRAPDEDNLPPWRYWSSTIEGALDYVCLFSPRYGGIRIYDLNREDFALLRCVRGPVDMTGAR
ncbi:MAG: DUF1566 domain-containing protein [Planctomycetes bacterium]|nr:DUF1566 domain-containing protein [Planctomycetota bacterium]